MTAFSGPVRDLTHDDDEVPEGEPVSISEIGTALGAVDRASIDMQIATAKRYPRSITKSLREATTLATLDEKTAESMMYALKRKEAGGGTKVIEGPSARLAEILAYSWGNLRVDADIVGEDAKFVTAMSTCFDLEKNVAIRVRVRRRITDKNGRRYGDDMVGTTSNAALSIALRNSVFKVIPRALVNRIYEKARKAALGEGRTITQLRQAMLEYWGKLAVRPEEVYAFLGIAGVDDLTEDHLLTLKGLANAVKEGEQKVEELFRSANHSEGTHDLNAALSAKKATPASAAAAPSAKGDNTEKCSVCLEVGTHRKDCPNAPRTTSSMPSSATDDDLEADDQATLLEDEKRKGGKR